MWCEKIIRNASDATPTDWAGKQVEYVDLHWNECGRLLKKTTRAGQAVRAILPLGETVRHGDVLFEDTARAVVVNLLPCEVIVAHPKTSQQFALLSLELGNLHWPTQITESEIIFIEDGPPMEAVGKLNIAWSRQERRFEPATIVSATGVRIATDFRILRRQSEKAGQAGQIRAFPPPNESV